MNAFLVFVVATCSSVVAFSPARSTVSRSALRMSDMAETPVPEPPRYPSPPPPLTTYSRHNTLLHLRTNVLHTLSHRSCTHVVASYPPCRPFLWSPARRFDAKQQSGVSGPFGFFDPLGLAPSNERDFKKFKEAELKHGRVAMVAFLGILAGEAFPFLFGSDISGPAIFQYQQAEGIFNAWSANVIGLTLAVEGFSIVKVQFCDVYFVGNLNQLSLLQCRPTSF